MKITINFVTFCNKLTCFVKKHCIANGAILFRLKASSFPNKNLFGISDHLINAFTPH